MNINATNISSGQPISIDTNFISTVEIQTSTTLKVTMKNKMIYIVEANEELLKKAPKQLELFDMPKIDLGEQKKIRGIKRAVDHANVKNAGTWSDKAYQASKLFLASKSTGFIFMVEDIRTWTEEHNMIPAPPSKRAWGGMVRSLVSQGLIKKVGHGTVKNENAHKCFAAVWCKI
jgi:hypothetical protein